MRRAEGADRTSGRPLRRGRGGRVLGTLVFLNLAASGSHFAHNALFFDHYPLPGWISGPGLVVGSWFVIASALVIGFRWLVAGRRGRALVAMGAYVGGSVLGLAHYLYGPPSDLSFFANAFILAEATAALALAGHVAWLGGRLAPRDGGGAS